MRVGNIWEMACDMTEKDILNDLNRISREFCSDSSMTWKDVQEHGKHHPETYQNVTGKKFNELKKLAGEEIDRRGGDESYSKKDIIQFIENTHREHKKCPSTATVKEFCKCSPGYTRFWDSWYGAIEDTSIDLEQYRHHHNNYTTKEKLEELAWVVKREKKYISAKEFNENSPISHKSLIREFGKWTEFFPWQLLKKGLITRLEEFDGCGRPKMKDVENWNVSSNIYYSLFGSWSKALEEAGYESPANPDYVPEYGSSWKGRRDEVRQRDGFQCRVCGQQNGGGNIHTHHIDPRKNYDVEEAHEEMNRVDNLVCLCATCHSKYGGMWTDSQVEEFVDRAKAMEQEERTLLNF